MRKIMLNGSVHRINANAAAIHLSNLAQAV